MKLPNYYIRFIKDSTLRFGLAGDCLLWFKFQGLFADKDKQFEIHDLWELQDGDSVILTNRQPDIPTWFELHPTEVSGAAVYAMTEKLNKGYQPREVMNAPNLWKVLAGDRLVLVGDSPDSKTKDIVRDIIALEENALVIGESTRQDFDPLEFGALKEQRDSPRLSQLCLIASDIVQRLGTPRVMGTEWTLG